MPLTVQRVHIAYRHRPVLVDINLGLVDGDAVALIGANGSGKSTLLRICAGSETPDEGQVIVPGHEEVGYLPQFVPPMPAVSLRAYLAEASAGLVTIQARLRAIERELTGSTDPELLDEYGDLLARFELRGGWDLENRAEHVLAGLGLEHLGLDRLLDALSGGQRSRIALAALLLASPDVLLLDEPTNHLDASALDWLAEFVGTYRGAVLYVSHDRDFIDRTAKAILELSDHDHRVRRYAGNYAEYMRSKAGERERQQQAHQAWRDEVDALREAVQVTARGVGHRRVVPRDNDKAAFKAHRAAVEQAVSRNVRAAQKRLSRLLREPVPPPPDPVRFQTSFASSGVPADSVVIGAQDLTFRHGGGPRVVDRATFTVGGRDRICLVGPNGAGKTTLLRLLAGRLTPTRGELTHHRRVRIGYLAQELTVPAAGQTTREYLRHRCTGGPYAGRLPEALGLLVRWGMLERDDLNRPAHDLSPGQLRRLDIALLALDQPDLLLLDEPTNHLALPVVEAVENALREFAGPVVAATHDTRFHRNIGGQIWPMVHGRPRIGDSTVWGVATPDRSGDASQRRDR